MRAPEDYITLASQLLFRGDLDGARGVLFDALEAYLVASREYENADRVLALAVKRSYPVQVRASLLAASSPWADILPSRNGLREGLREP